MNTAKRFFRRNGKAAAMAVALAGLLASGNASAQWIVNDPAHMGVQMGEFGTQASRFGDQIRQWAKEYQEWKQQYDSLLTRLTNLNSSMGMSEGISMEKVEPGFNVEEKCGPRGGGGVSGILGRLTTVDFSANPQRQRWENCRNIVVAKNMKFNEMVDYMNEGMEKQRRSIEAAYNKNANRELTSGDQASADLEYKAHNDMVEQDRRKFEERQKAYDTYIAQQTQLTETLTQVAMRGNAGLIQQITTTAIMREKLCGGGQCERHNRAAVGQ